MNKKVVRHSVKRHWPKIGISWPKREALSQPGKHHFNPLPGQSGWLRRIQRALDYSPRYPNQGSKMKAYIDSSFTELVAVAHDKCGLLAKVDFLTFIRHVKEDVPWVNVLSFRCTAALFLAIHNGRGLYKIQATHPVDEHRCAAARMMDMFLEKLQLVGQLKDVQISRENPDGGDPLVESCGMISFIERGLVHPENQLIETELCEGIHRLRVTRQPQRDDTGLAEAIDQMGFGTPDEGEKSHSVDDNADVSGGGKAHLFPGFSQLEMK